QRGVDARARRAPALRAALCAPARHGPDRALFADGDLRRLPFERGDQAPWARVMPPWLTVQGLKAAWSAIRAGLLVAVVGFVLAVTIVQTVRLNGFQIGPFESEGALARAD